MVCNGYSLVYIPHTYMHRYDGREHCLLIQIDQVSSRQQFSYRVATVSLSTFNSRVFHGKGWDQHRFLYQVAKFG